MPVRDDNIGINEVIESQKPSSKRNVQKDKRNKKRGKGKGKGTSGTSRRYEITGNIITLQAGQDNPVNSLTSDLVGATLVVSNPHTLVVSDLYSTELGFTLPTTYSTTISKVINSKTFEVSEPYYVTDKRGKKFPARLKAGSITITYDTFKTETEDTIYQRSYANLTIGNLRTFSGDVYKAKIYYRPSLPQTDFEEIYDTFVVPENVLVDSTSINQYENIGFFHTGSIVANNWVSSSTNTETEPFITLNNDKLIDGIQISGSVKDLEDKVTFRTKNSFDLEQSVDYVVRFNSYYFKALSEVRDSNNSVSTTNRASLKVFVSGSALTGANGEADFFLGEVDIPNNSADEGEIPDIIGRFKSSGTGSPKAWLKFELNSGRFIVQDVSVEPFSETNFNPSFFKVLVPMPIPQGKRVDKYDFLVEFYDSNNNLAETTAQVNGVQFRGPRQVIADGLDAVLSGSMLMGESIEMYGSNPAYLRSVGYQGFDKTRDGSSLASGGRNGGFLMWSGSIGSGAPLNRLTSSEAYNGVGLEIVDASNADPSNHSFLQFASNYKNTGNSRFRVQTKEFLLGISSSASNNYISGSNGNLEISSSNFELNGATGNVTLQGTITAAAGGTIGGFTIGSNDIHIGNSSGDDNYISIDSANRKFRIGRKASIDDGNTGVHIGANGIALGASSVFKVTNAGAVTAGNITATGGTIGGFHLGSTSLHAGDTGIGSVNTKMVFRDILNGGVPKFSLGTSANSSTLTSGNDGVYMDGGGDFRVGDADGHRISFDQSEGTLFMSSSKFFLGSKADGESFISASNGELEISSSFFHVSKSGFITGSRVKFTGGVVGGWTLSDTTLTGGTITLDSSGIIEAGGLTGISDTTNTGFYVDNSGQLLVRQGDNDFIKFSSGEIDLQTRKFELDANNLEISSTQASMSLGEGKIRLKGGSTSFMTIGTGGNAISASVDASDKFISIGKSDFSEFDQTTKGFIVGDNGGIFRFEVALDAQNYMSFDGTANTLDIKTEKFKLDTDRLDIDSDNSRISVFDDAASPKEVVRIGQVDGAVDSSNANYGMKIFDGTGTDDTDILVEFSETENNIAGWDISTSTISKNNMIISSEGFIQSAGFSSGVIAGSGQGFILTAEGNGYLEVEKARIRGTLSTAVFEKETVNAVGGMLMVANSTVISESVASSNTTMSVENVNGFVGSYDGFNSSNKQQLDNIDNVTGEVVLVKKVDNTGFTTEYLLIQSSSFYDKTAADAGTNPSGYLYVTRSFGGANSGTGDSSTPTKNSFATEDPAQAYTPGQVIASTGRYISGTGDNTTGTGYIFMNANPNDQYAPYIDIVERTGSKVYDMDLKVRLGDLTGLSQARLLGTTPSDAGFGLYAENAFLEGGIISRYGSIGGFNMDSTDLWAGNSDKSNAGTKIVIGDAADGGTPKIALGGQADSITLTDRDGVFIDGDGNFRVGDADGDRLIFQNGNFAVTSSNFGLDAGTLHISSSNNGAIALGTGGPGSQAPTQLDDNGILLLGSGYFNLQNSATNYIRNNASGFDIKSTTFGLDATTLIVDSATNSGVIKLGASGGPGSATGTSNGGAYIDGTGKFNFVGDANNFIRFNSSGLEINTAKFDVNTSGEITATGGTIGGFTITSTELFSLDSGTPDSSPNNGITIDTTGGSNSKAVIRVFDGTTENAALGNFASGKFGIKAIEGDIGGFTIDADEIKSTNLLLDSSNEKITLGSANAITLQGGNPDNFMVMGGKSTFGQTTTAGVIIGMDATVPTLELFKDANNKFIFNNSGIDIKAETFDLEATSTTTVNSKSHTAGILMDSSTALIQVSSQSSAIVGGEVSESKVTINGSGHIVVSQSSVPIFESGREFIFSSIQDMVVNSLPQETITQVEDGDAFEGQTVSQAPQQGSTAGADTIIIGGVETGIPATRISSAVIDNHVSASKVGVGSSFFLRNKSSNSSENTKFRVFIQDDAATSKAVGSQPVQAGFDFRKTIEDGQFTNSHALGQAMVFSNYVSSKDADSRYVANGNTTGSAIYHFQNILDQGSSGKWADAKFALMRLDADVQSIDTARNTEFVFLEARSSRTAATENKVVFQVQYDGEVVSSANITAFGTTFMNVSDKRLKENIYDVSGSLNKILQLRPTHFTWKENQKDDVGFIAQEVEEIIPEVVEVSNGFIDVDGTEENKIKDMKTISYPKLVPYLVDTIQVLNKRIEELEKKVK